MVSLTKGGCGYEEVADHSQHSEPSTPATKISTLLEQRANGKSDTKNQDNQTGLQAMVNKAVEAKLPQLMDAMSEAKALKDNLNTALEEMMKKYVEAERKAFEVDKKSFDLDKKSFDLEKRSLEMQKKLSEMKTKSFEVDIHLEDWTQKFGLLRQQTINMTAENLAVKDENAKLKEKVAKLGGKK